MEVKTTNAAYLTLALAFVVLGALSVGLSSPAAAFAYSDGAPWCGTDTIIHGPRPALQLQ